MAAHPRQPSGAGYAVPPDIYDIGFGWDPQAEIERLLFLARQAGVEPRCALELGCGTGRLLHALRPVVPAVCGIELAAGMAAAGHDRGVPEIVVGDMTDFVLARRFDLIFTSANTIRHALSDDVIARLWQCAAQHLTPGGVFIADLELGFAAEGAKVGQPATWTIARGPTEVRVTWLVSAAPSPRKRCCRIELAFEARGPQRGVRWEEQFELRVYDAEEFVRLAPAGGKLRLSGLYELRDPYLVETPVEKAVGRFLVVLKRTSGP